MATLKELQELGLISGTDAKLDLGSLYKTPQLVDPSNAVPTNYMKDIGMGGLTADGYLTADALKEFGLGADKRVSPYDVEKMYPSKSESTDWGMDGYGGVALGAGQLGLGVLGYMENKKTADKQRQLMDQQISSNRFALDTAKSRQNDIRNAFGTKPIGA